MKTEHKLLIVSFIIFVFGVIVFYFQPTEKIQDTDIRRSLLREKSVIKKTASSSSPNVDYSSFIFDAVINRSHRGPLIWSNAINKNPDNRYTFTWRIKVTNPSVLNIIKPLIVNNDSYAISISTREGQNIYFDNSDTEIGLLPIIIMPDIYIIHMDSDIPLDRFEYNVDPYRSPDNQNESNQYLNSIKYIDFFMDNHNALQLKKMAQLTLSDRTKSLKNPPKNRIKAKMFDHYSQNILDIDMQLAGRTGIHFTYFPSTKITVKNDDSYFGMTTFKLYRLDAKGFLSELILSSVLRDVGIFAPRQFIIGVSVYSVFQGYYLAYEESSPSLFESQKRERGDIVGYDVGSYLNRFPLGAKLINKYFFDTRNIRNIRRSIYSNNSSVHFLKYINKNHFSKFISICALWNSLHAVSIDDLRFYLDKKVKKYFPIVRDLNADIGTNIERVSQRFLTQFIWQFNQPVFTPLMHKALFKNSDPLLRNEVWLNSESDGAIVMTERHPQFILFNTVAENLKLVNQYVNYFSTSQAFSNQIIARSDNAYKALLEITNDKKTKDHYRSIIDAGLLNHIDMSQRNLLTKPIVIKSNRKYFSYNLRNSTVINPSLAPSYTAPMRTGADGISYDYLMSMHFLLEKKIYDYLNRKSIFHLKTFEEIDPPKNDNFIDADKELLISDNSQTLKNYRKDPQNIITFYGQSFDLDNDETIILFLVRNAVDDNAIISLKIEDQIHLTEPVLNEYFTLGTSEQVRYPSVIDIMHNHFYNGEKFRLLAYKVKLTSKLQYYKLKAPDNYYQYLPKKLYIPSNYSGDTSLDESQPALPSKIFVKEGGDYHIYPREKLFNIKETIYLPENSNLVIHGGVTLEFYPKASLVVNGDLTISGNPENPVRFNSHSKAKKGGGIIVLGSEKKVNINIEHLFFQNLGNFDDRLDKERGITGALTLVNAEARLSNISISNISSEDAIHLRNSNAIIDKMTINNVAFDGVDMDFSRAAINGLNITNSKGDGLDMSKSLAQCQNSTFAACKDKGISIGEKSVAIIDNCKFIKNNHGIANKDQSRLQLSDSRFDNNYIAIAEFIKKAYYGKPIKALSNIEYNNNQIDYKWLGTIDY